jgi:hypothetical protein
LRLAALLTWVAVSGGIVTATERADSHAWPRHVIDDSSKGADGVRLTDVNGDGRVDVVTGWEQGGVSRMYLQPPAGKVREKWPAVTVGRTPDVEDAVFADLDGDGATDVVTCSEGKTRRMAVHWAPKDKSRLLDPAAWETQLIPAAQGAMMWMFCLPMDVDGKNGIDLVAGGKEKGAQIGWWESPRNPRDLAAWTWHPMSDAGWVMSLIPFDMDGDGDLDVVTSDRKGAQSGCRWLENPGQGGARQQEPWQSHPIGPPGTVLFMTLADLDGDGLVDAVCGNKDRIVFHRRKAAHGKAWDTFPIEMPSECGGFKAVSVGDVDLDGKPDLVFTCEGAKGEKSGAGWLSYDKSPTEPKWRFHDIAGAPGVKYDLCPLLDLDGDGDLDVLTTEENDNLGVIWYENPTRAGASAD